MNAIALLVDSREGSDDMIHSAWVVFLCHDGFVEQVSERGKGLLYSWNLASDPGDWLHDARKYIGDNIANAMPGQRVELIDLRDVRA